MALADSRRAIGAVTRLLQDHLIRRGFEVSVGKPEQAATANTNAKLNLFLYETLFDANLKNVALDEQRPTPLWLTLKYLITAFDADENSDSASAHELLGRGLTALHELNFLWLDPLVAPDVRLALENNPEPLKLTFDETTAELLSKIMQGTDERYRLSVAFQMRPVMIALAEPPSYSLLVGIDYTTAPPTTIGEEGVHLDVLPTLGPRLTALRPDRFAAGDEIEVFGEELHLTGLECVLGDTVLTILSRRTDRLLVQAEGEITGGATEGPIAAGGAISAGEYPLIVRRPLSPTRFRSSNLLAARLLPTLDTGALDGVGGLTLTGMLLGTDDDDILVALHRDGRIVRAFDVVTTSADQHTLAVASLGTGLAAGDYRVILSVNSQQARSSPTVTLP
jgi:hypothetical protein